MSFGERLRDVATKAMAAGLVAFVCAPLAVVTSPVVAWRKRRAQRPESL